VSIAVREQSSAAASGHQLPALALQLADVHKSFKLPHEQYGTLKERAMHGFRTPGFDWLHAVDGVTIDVAAGEFFGIVGRNGSGKSTLLKCLAGIYVIDSGRIQVNGRLAPFIELGVGFNPELTARDNVVINAIMLGLTRKEALERFDDIVAFAELEEFLDLRLKNYSSGMQVRLAFSVAIQVDADIVLIDEVLAVGDANFQQKCFEQFSRLKAEGRTIVFVTHDMGAVERFCDRAMLLERGQVVDLGKPSAITRSYNELNFKRTRGQVAAERSPAEHPDQLTAEIRNAWFESESGQQIVTAPQGEGCCVRIDVAFHSDVTDPQFGITLRDENGHSAFATSTQLKPVPTGTFAAGQLASVRIWFENWLAPGRYRLTASVSRQGTGADWFDNREDVSSIIVHAGQAGGGIVDLPHRFEIERVN
jgi:ABC-type polysaccharide/polyol phosphate transport system ATPase subunit